MTDAHLLAAYRATRWTVWIPGRTLTLRIDEVFPAPPELLPAGVVTAYNPASEPRAQAVNRAAHARLERALAERGASLAPTLAGGTGPEAGRWDEPGFLVSGIARDLLVAVAGRFGQNAIVWLDEDGLPRLVSTRDGFCGTPPGDLLPDP